MIDPALPIFRERIRPAFIELIQGLLEQTSVVIIRGRPSKKCQARAKFEIIRSAQEFAGRICLRGVTSNAHLAQAFSQGRIIEVALGLIEVANRVRSAMVLWPKPATRGKMNHIQWVRLFPAVSFSTTRAYRKLAPPRSERDQDRSRGQRGFMSTP